MAIALGRRLSGKKRITSDQDPSRATFDGCSPIRVVVIVVLVVVVVLVEKLCRIQQAGQMRHSISMMTQKIA